MSRKISGLIERLGLEDAKSGPMKRDIGDNPRNEHGRNRRGGHGGHRGLTRPLQNMITENNRDEAARDTRPKTKNSVIRSRGQKRFQSADRVRLSDKPRETDMLNFGKMRNYERRDPANILLNLGHDYSGLHELLNLPRQKSDMVKLTLSVLAKSFKCESSPQSLNNVLSKLPRSMFFTIGIVNVLMEIETTDDREATENSRKVIIDICDILCHVYRQVPGSCADLIGVTDILTRVVDDLRASTDVINDDALICFREVEELKERKFKQMKERQKSKVCGNVEVEEGDPPNDFHDISLLPTLEDLDPNNSPFLRRNKLQGGYENVMDYLDVQFRLLREDFIQPLRNGISEYKTITQGYGTNGQRPQDIRIYTDVSIIRSVCSRTDLLHRLRFDVSKLNRVNWTISKRLIYGSLVCLSSDEFKTFFVATVADRDPKQLQKGYIDVKFEDDLMEINIIETDRQFVMVETTAYFEAYRHVLKGLQAIRHLPFENYIVKSLSDVRPPKYLRENQRILFDLRPLVDEEIELREDENLRRQGRLEAYNFSTKSNLANNINVLNLNAWPDHELLSLDESQYNALQTALTKEFSVIQGPPGTGKTYVGLKIVKALLHNFRNWNTLEQRPMLIVCYTNHALDQFLEGILKFYRGKLVRVGGRINSPELEDYSLKSWKRKAREQGRFKDLGRLGFIHGDKLKILHRKIEIIGQRLEAAEGDILTEDEIRHVMSPKHRTQLENTEHKDTLAKMGYIVPQMPSVMVEWLGLGNRGQFTEAMLNEPEDVNPDDGDNEEEVIEVQDEGQLAMNNRLLDGDVDKNKEFEHVIQESIKYKHRCIAFDISNLDKDDSNMQVDDGFQIPREARKKLKRKLRQYVKSRSKMSQDDADAIDNIWQLDIKARWRLYRLWVAKHCEIIKREITTKSIEYKQTCTAQMEVNFQKDRNIMSDATIIAMTTTGAARYQAVLQELNPRIIIVEEAAEVLEGHIITTLTRGCEQLILIGDHKQLRPNPNVYTLATRYNLQVSLFERMIKNGVHYDCLELQHRMCPEISKLMKPIYPNLKDHESVKTFEKVKGMSTNIYFINHGNREQHDNEMMSHSNLYEAQYIVALAEYFLKQGYSHKEITILTAYSGQLFQLKKLMPKSRYEGLRVTPVDNFQGEENEIILLSLVRSNVEEKIGFLSIENRICVALSRAKKGLYVIGNFDILASKSPIWKEMTIMLKKSNEFGGSLLLQCQNHPEDPGIEICKPEDFQKAPAGGCQKLCSARLDCGHSCVMACHPTDLNHEEYDCTKPCTKVCKEGHPCKRKCFQVCGDCKIQMQKTVPLCGHVEMIKCHKPAKEHKCTHPCIKILDCSHLCGNLCGFSHSCKTMVKKNLTCGHTEDILCPQKDNAKCTAQCEKTLECGHNCRGTCSGCFNGRLHQPCQQKCPKDLICNHSCESTCSYCPPCKKRCGNKCQHSKCPKLCGELCTKCQEPCSWRCEHFKCGKTCSQPCDRQPCNHPCQKKLKCNHDCIGLCGEPCPQKCRICDKAFVTNIFFGTEDDPKARFVELKDCGHLIEYTSLDTWMNQDTSSTTTNTIQMKCCPRCKTPIRRCVRYGTIINRLLENIDQVKRIYVGNRENIEKLRGEILQEIRSKFLDPIFRVTGKLINTRSFLEAKEKLKDTLKTCNSENALVTVQNQLRFLEKAKDLYIKLKKVEENFRPLQISKTNEYQQINANFSSFNKWLSIRRSGLGEQEILDAQSEISRLSLIINLFHNELTIDKRHLTIPDSIKARIGEYKIVFKDEKPISSETTKMIENDLKQLEKLVPASGLGITEQERVMVVKAMELNRGQWFKCKNGHVYAIGDCGGATNEGVCPECKTTIGGASHRLRDDNNLAPEMDGASHAAWSEQTNLLNYGFHGRY